MNLRSFRTFVGNNKLRIAEAGCLIISLAVVITAAITISYQRFTSTGAYRQRYSGIIVDKVTRFNESEQGSSMGRYLIIEEESKGRTEVIVSEDVYQRASVGMRINKSDKGIDLVPSQ